MSTDDLLDEATRLHYGVIRDDRDAEWRRLTAEHDLVPALIERAQQAEAERDTWHQAALTATAGESRAERERDEARGKLDKVRARITNERARAEHDYEPDGYIDWLDDTIAILDE